METEKREASGRLKITYIFILFVALLVIVSAMMLYGSFKTDRSLSRMQELTTEYISGQDAIDKMREASDYLTYESRAFVVSGDVKNGQNYFKEIRIDKRRDRSLETIEKYGKDEEIYKAVKNALKESNKLADVECYAMRLACDGHGIDPETVSGDLVDVKLTAEDKALSNSEKVSKATTMLFDDNYDEMKSNIINNVIGGLGELVERTHEKQLESYEHAKELSKREHIMLFVILIATLAMLFVTASKLIVPLRKSTQYIKNGEPLPVEGVYEYAYLADTYNSMLEQTMKHHEELSYEVTHDELTGLYNRKMFESKREELADADTAMLIVDLDHFKQVNDTYGHETGDRVLKKVADALRHSFRLEDYVCRIGGDEFAVIMVQMKPELLHVVEDKIANVRERMTDEDGLPPSTLSIGAAFSGDPGDDDIFKKADKALYKTKEKGRNGYTFYSRM